MTIVVVGSRAFFDKLNNGQANIEWLLTDLNTLFEDRANAHAFFLEEKPAEIDAYTSLGVPVFINDVINPLPTYQNIIRFNGWPGFLENESWELCGDVNSSVENILQHIGKEHITCADEPGFISARIIAMIINEAFIARAEGVSTTAEIDVAMKLGTNYPYGPFEWADKIGPANIHALLNKLCEVDNRYQPAAGLAEIQLHK